MITQVALQVRPKAAIPRPIPRYQQIPEGHHVMYYMDLVLVYTSLDLILHLRLCTSNHRVHISTDRPQSDTIGHQKSSLSLKHGLCVSASLNSRHTAPLRTRQGHSTCTLEPSVSLWYEVYLWGRLLLYILGYVAYGRDLGQ